MSGLARFSVSVEEELLKALDTFVAAKGYPTRSEAVKHLVRNALVETMWKAKGTVAGVIVMAYDHHKRDVVRKLLEVQHDHSDVIISTQHVHLDHDNCMETITVRGRAGRIKKLESAIRSLKGLKHSDLMVTAGGRAVP
ncbi:nickel-responsive transcriptional regulator NikR [Planctomycetota bacterium]